jgi:predicted neutral ceramidase superfamily lipid hydrolase
MNIILFKSHRPIIAYLFVICIITLLIYFFVISSNILTSLFYCSIIAGISYFFLLRDSHIIELYHNRLIVKTLTGKIKIDCYFDKIISYDYYRSIYCLLSPKVRSNLVERPYDTLYLKIEQNKSYTEHEIHLNLLVFEFSKLLRILRKQYLNAMNT